MTTTGIKKMHEHPSHTADPTIAARKWRNYLPGCLYRTHTRVPLGSVVCSCPGVAGVSLRVRKRTSGSAPPLRPLSGPSAAKAALGRPSAHQHWRGLALQQVQEELPEPWVGPRSRNPESQEAVIPSARVQAATPTGLAPLRRAAPTILRVGLGVARGRNPGRGEPLI